MLHTVVGFQGSSGLWVETVEGLSPAILEYEEASLLCLKMRSTWTEKLREASGADGLGVPHTDCALRRESGAQLGSSAG